jgi:hypothetical protein
VVSQQICPACATPNSTYANKCRNCSTALTPRPLPGDPVFPWNGGNGEPAGHSPAAKDAEADSLTEYETVPHAAGTSSETQVARHRWPAQRMTPSQAGDGHGAALWAGLPPAEAGVPGSNGSHPEPSGSASSATPPLASAGSSVPPAAAAPDAAPPAPLAADRPASWEAPPADPEVDNPAQPGSFSFHLDGGTGAEAGNGQHRSPSSPEAPPVTDRPAPTSALAAVFASPGAAPAAVATADDGPVASAAVGDPPTAPAGSSPVARPGAPFGEPSGGRGWGVRESRTPPPAWAPVAPPPNNGETGSPAAAPGYSAGPPFLAAVPPMAAAGAPGSLPWAGAVPARPRSNAVKGLFALLVAVVLLFAGGFWYFADGPGAAKAHTVSAPTTLAGLSINTGGAVGQVTSAFQAKFAGEPGVKNAVYAYYGDGQSTTGYLLGLFAIDRTVNGADLTQFVNGFNSGGSSSFDLSSATSTVQGGVTYRCGPVGLSAFTGTLCVWEDGNVLGWIVGLPGESGGATLGAAEEARSTGEH